MSQAESKADRDLSFAPTSTANPRTLTPEQVASYNQLGYLFPFDAYTPAEADANRAYFDGLLDELHRQRPDANSYAINGFHSRCEGIYEMATHPAVLDRVEDLIGPNIVAWGTHFFCKVPHDPKAVPWHQDASY